MRVLDRLRSTSPVVLIVAAGVIHRVGILWIYSTDLRRVVFQNHDWLTWQYFPRETLTTNLWNALVYLQETPPIPQFVLALVLKSFEWPLDTARALIVLQGAVTILSAVLLFRLLNRVVRQSVALVLALAFVLSRDVLILEYNSLGQTIYENLAMLMLLALVWTYYRLIDTARTSDAIQLGCLAGGLALTRSAYSYFFLVPGLFLLASVVASRRGSSTRRESYRHLMVYSLCILLTQGSWSAKNLFVYSRFSLSTSSWQGMNLAVGMDRFSEEIGNGWRAADPRRQPFVRSILDSADRYPTWFTTMIKTIGIAHWHSDWLPFIPDDIRRRDADVQRALAGGNARENMVAVSVMSDLYSRAWFRFALADPSYVAKKFIASYRLFWQPIGNYGAVALGPLQIEPRIRDGFDIWRAARLAITESPCENQYVMRGTMARKSLIPSCFFTMPWLPELIPVVGFLAIHFVTPVLLASGLLLARARQLSWSKGFLFLGVTYLYAALTMNLSEHGENMRFRLSIEPLIWLMSASAIAILAELGCHRTLKGGHRCPFGKRA